MSEEKALIEFHQVTQVAPDGELRVSAGKYSRAMIVMAFEMMGGVEAFAEWAMNNKGDFYTKMFSKTLGREMDGPNSDPVEKYLAVLDLEAEDITPDDAPPELVKFAENNMTGAKLAEAASMYATGEPED